MINSINDIHKKYDLVSVTDEYHQLSADEFNAIVSCLKNIQTYLSNVETTELSIQHDIPNNKFMVNTDDVEAFLKFTPRYKKIKTNTETGSVDTKDILTECNITISSQKGNILLPFEGERCYTGIQLSVDIRSLLATGTNYVDVMVSANGETEHALFTVVLTALSLSENKLQWHIPFYSTDSIYQIGGFLITGVIDKTVHIDISGNGYHKHYTDNIGENTYSSNAYTYKLTNEDFPTTGTGSYNVDVYVTADDIETQHIIYDMLCVEHSDVSSATLIAVKQPTSKILNLTSLKIAEYVVYDGKSETSDVQIKVTTLQDNLGEIILANTGTISVKTNTSNKFEALLGYSGKELTKDAVCIISAKNKQKSFNFVIDNSTSIPPVPGASFYIDPANRYNSSSDKEFIINAVNNNIFEAQWNGVSFVDGVDGWTVDGDKKNQRKALVLPAASSCNINYQPLASADTDTSKVFDFVYKVKNVSDYTQPIITICDNVASDDFVGIKIFPTKVLVHSNFKKSPTTYDLVLGTNIKDEELVSVQICMCPGYNLNYGDFLIIYVNGVKKCEFAYNDGNEDDDSRSDSFQNSGNVILGGDYADFYLYSFRIYDFPFNYKHALTNFYSSLHTITEKQNAFAEDEAVLGDNNEINFDKVKDTNKYNYFVVEPLDDAELPAYGKLKGYLCDCNFEMHYPNESNWDYYIKNATLLGQGTTSMSYYVWNLRVRTDKNSNTEVSYNGTDFTESNTVNIDGGNHPAVKRITAKKNYASSMQSHKMGSTAAFNDLREAVYISRDEQNKIFARTAVYQYPAYGFIKKHDERGHELYRFIGLYTIGPDKGDKATFGYDGTYSNTLLSLEGLDHNRPLTLFKYPWTIEVGCHDGENIGIKTGNDSYDNGWEISAGNSKFIDTLVDTLWRPAYQQVYKNSPFIIGVSQPIGDINSDVQAFRSQPLGNGRKYEDYDIWTENYTLYYYDLGLKQYVPTDINVYEDVASYIDSTEWYAAGTLLEKNDLIIKARVKRFKETMSDYWDVEDALFHYCFVMMFAASDNFAKNTYPYNLGSSDSKWMWRQDDLDTLFDIDNYGRATKDASVEYEDITADGTQYVFKGNQSAFWTLIHLAYEVYDTDGMLPLMGRDILHAMCDLGALGESSVQYSYSGIVKFFQKYYFDKAEEYFTKSSYNVDAEISYESAHADKEYRRLVDPLSQSLGNHIEATKFWLERRIIYLMSKYSFGEFGSYSATDLGTILVRPQQSLDLTLIPAIDMYPTIMSGQGARFKSNDRVFAGNSAYITGEYGGSGTNTSIYIAAADYIREIQGLEHLKIESNTGLTISSKRLQRLDIGRSSVNDPNGTNIDILNIEDCPSLEYINANNVNTLQNVIDLSKCPRIKEAYFEGTGILGITIANGAKIHTLSLPDSIKSLTLRNLQNLETFDIAGIDNLSYIRIENTPNILTNLYIFDLLLLDNASENARPVRVDANDNYISTAIKIDNLNIQATGEQMFTLLNYCNHADSNLAYIHGIDVNGSNNTQIYPVLSGTIAYDDENDLLHTTDVETINNIFPYINLQTFDLIVDFDEDLRTRYFTGNEDTYTASFLASRNELWLRNLITLNPYWYATNVAFNQFKYFEGIQYYFANNYYFPGSTLSDITLPKNLKRFYSTANISLYDNNDKFYVQRIHLGENKNFKLLGNCLIGNIFAEDGSFDTLLCIQGEQVKIPSNVKWIMPIALRPINQNVLVIPDKVEPDYYYDGITNFSGNQYIVGSVNKAIIFENGNSANTMFGLYNNDNCDVYIIKNGPNNNVRGSQSYWAYPNSEHHVYVPIGTKQQYVDYFDGHYPPELFEEFNPETDETFLSLMEEYNNMKV